MIFEPLEGRSDEWRNARLGMPTASNFHRIITAKRLQPSTAAPLYEAELIGEKIFRRSVVKDISHYEEVRWGIEHEAEAAEKLEEWLPGLLPGGFELKPGGFMRDSEPGRYGCSPDRIIVSGNRRIIVEIKCPQIPRHIANLVNGFDDDYMAQVQGQLLISGYEEAIFFSYHPDCPPSLVRVAPDKRFMAKLQQLLNEFCESLETNYQRAVRMGKWRI